MARRIPRQTSTITSAFLLEEFETLVRSYRKSMPLQVADAFQSILCWKKRHPGERESIGGAPGEPWKEQRHSV
jgi:hypothetical protein